MKTQEGQINSVILSLLTHSYCQYIGIELLLWIVMLGNGNIKFSKKDIQTITGFWSS